jgi:Zn-dependent protease
MSSDAGRPVAPFTAVGRVEPHPPPGFALRRDDFGAFRAVEPGTNDLIALRPATDGLLLDRREGRELVPWSAIVGLTLTFVDAGRAKVPAVRVQLMAGPSLDYADALAPGADDLPLTLGPGQNRLLRVERCRMLTAVIASAAGLAPATARDFRRGPRGVDVPELALRPRVLPRWLPPLGLPLSVVAFVLVFGARWTTAVAVTCVLVLHELGHALAMKLVGIRVRGFLFVPLFGAATLPEHSFNSRWDEARVALAGPVSGLPTAGVIVLLLVTPPVDWIGRGALGVALLWALGVNVLNLIPILPLDGGRVLASLTATLPRAARTTFAYLPIVALATVSVFVLQGNVLLGALVFVAFAVSVTRMTLRRQDFLGWMEGLPQPLAAVRTSLRDVTYAFSGGAREDLDGGVAVTPLSAGQTAVVLVAWGTAAALLLVAVVVFVAACPWVLDQFKAGG